MIVAGRAEQQQPATRRCTHAPDDVALPGRIPAGAGDQHRPAVPRHLQLHRVDDLGEERIGDGLHHEPDRGVRARPQGIGPSRRARNRRSSMAGPDALPGDRTRPAGRRSGRARRCAGSPRPRSRRSRSLADPLRGMLCHRWRRNVIVPCLCHRWQAPGRAGVSGNAEVASGEVVEDGSQLGGGGWRPGVGAGRLAGRCRGREERRGSRILFSSRLRRGRWAPDELVRGQVQPDQVGSPPGAAWW